MKLVMDFYVIVLYNEKSLKRAGAFVKKQFLETGIFVGTHGLKGELRLQPWCDSPETLTEFDRLYLNGGGDSFEITSAKVHKNIVIMKLNGVDDIESAERYRGKTVYLDRDSLELDDGDYFIQDLIGCRVFDADSGQLLGELTDVSKTGANDVWHIARDGKEYLIPAIPDVVISVDIDDGKIIIRPLRGIFDED